MIDMVYLGYWSDGDKITLIMSSWTLRSDLNLNERASIISSLTYSSANILHIYYVLRYILDTKNNHEEKTKKLMSPWTYRKSSKPDGTSGEILDGDISLR